MKKKILSLVLTGVLATTFVACAPKATDAAPSTSKDASASTTMADPAAEITVQAEKTWMPYYQEVVKTLQAKYPKSKINLKESGSFDMIDVLVKTDATNADVADVFAIPADRLFSLNKKEALAPLPAEDMAKAVGGFNDFANGLGGTLKIDKDYLAFPLNIETLVTFFNPANAKAANVDTTKPFDLNDANAGQVLLKAHDAWFGVALTNSAGINLLGKDAQGKLTSDLVQDWAALGADKQAVFTSLYNFWKNTYNNGGAELWDIKTGDNYINNNFKDGGKTVYRIDGPWATGDLKKIAPTTDVAPLSQITLNGKPLKHWKSGWGLAVNSRIATDKNKMALAQEVIKEVVNPKNAENLFKTTGKILENVSAADYDKTNLNEMDKKVVKAIIESYKTAEARPIFDEWGQVWPSWQNAVLSWNTKKPASAEEAYKLIQDSFKTMMATFGN